MQFSSLLCSDIKRPALPLGLVRRSRRASRSTRTARVVGRRRRGGRRRATALDRDPGPDVDVPPEEQAALAGHARLRGAGGDPRRSHPRRRHPPRPTPNAHGAGGGRRAARPDRGRSARAAGQALVAATLGGVAGRGGPALPHARGRGARPRPTSRTILDAGRAADRAHARRHPPAAGQLRPRLHRGGRPRTAACSASSRTRTRPNFGIDVSVQKARTANFFSSPDRGRRAAAARASARYLRDGVPLDGSVAFTSRAVGFLAQPFFPPGIDGHRRRARSRSADPRRLEPVQHRPPARPRARARLARTVGLRARASPRLPQRHHDLPRRRAALQGRPPGRRDRHQRRRRRPGRPHRLGGLGRLRGARRSGARDQLVVRGVRLPYVKFPRHPEL